MGVIMSCYWSDGRMWLTACANRHRVAAIRRDPRCSLVVTSSGTKLGAGKSVTMKGRCIVHEDSETKDWFYPRFASHLNPDPAGAEEFRQRLDSPLRVVLEAGVPLVATSANESNEPPPVDFASAWAAVGDRVDTLAGYVEFTGG